VHFVFPTGNAEFNASLAVRAGSFFVISLAGLFLMHLVGFIIAAPIMIMVIMVFVGERRPLWLIAGIVLIPLAIWSSIELLLGRPLP
jgi:putative tricarboxylic transport membrane protein